MTTVVKAIRWPGRSAARTTRRGDAGIWPVVGGLIAIAVVFGSLNQHFLSAENLTNLALQLAATGMLSLGIILVLLLGEIDLSAGSVSGLCAAVLAIVHVRQGHSALLAVVIALALGAVIGLVHGLMFTQLRMPSFVVTLAGLIGWQGLLLYVLGRDGTINLPFDGSIARLSDTWLPLWVSWLLVVLIVGTAGTSAVLNRRLRRGAGLPLPPLNRPVLRIAGLAGLLCAAVLVLSADRGVPLLLVIFGALVVAVDLVLRNTVFGQWLYAIGGNAEAARRAGIPVTRLRIIAFVLASTLAAFGGLLAASRLAAVNQSSGGSDTLMMAIAAAVIGGVSLFGGRGRAYAALLGILVIQAITNGMLLLNVNSSIRLMVTAIVLAAAVAIDSVSRRGSQR